MTLDELIGARLAIGIPGPEVTEEIVETFRVTGAQQLILFSWNVVSVEQCSRLLRQLEALLERKLLVLVDHEGGRIIRFHEGVTRFPDALTVGRTQRPEEVERQGATEAEELKRLGVRVNLAPCADVLMPDADPVIGDRSYGADSDRVAEYTVARIRGLQSHGVAACAKHFPGLGAVQRDPHQTLPTIALDWAAMRATHLPPFEAAIRAGVAMIMSSHVCYPALGDPPDLPATFSPRLMRTLLREELGFDGVIVTDDLEMGALCAFGTMGELCARATEAGHDLLLICSGLSAAREAAKMLRRAYASGRLSQVELERSVERILTLRRRFLYNVS